MSWQNRYKKNKVAFNDRINRLLEKNLGWKWGEGKVIDVDPKTPTRKKGKKAKGKGKKKAESDDDTPEEINLPSENDADHADSDIEIIEEGPVRKGKKEKENEGSGSKVQPRRRPTKEPELDQRGDKRRAAEKEKRKLDVGDTIMDMSADWEIQVSNEPGIALNPNGPTTSKKRKAPSRSTSPSVPRSRSVSASVLVGDHSENSSPRKKQKQSNDPVSDDDDDDEDVALVERETTARYELTRLLSQNTE